MDLKVWMDGQLVPASEAAIGVYDHGLLYGDGVFEGIRAYNGRVFKLDRHLDRLFASAEVIRLSMPYTAEQIGKAIYQTMEANGQSDAYIRLIMSGLGLRFRKLWGSQSVKSAWPSQILFCRRPNG